MDSLVLDSPVSVADDVTLAALLRCYAREVAGPRGAARTDGAHLLLHAAGAEIRVRAAGGIALRFTGAPEYREDGGEWRPLTVERMVRLVERELDGSNEEFAGQVAGSREALALMLKARADAEPPRDRWLASEQALVFGHPFHPSPKARGGEDWPAYAPEAHASFPLRMLAVRRDLLAEAGDTAVLDAAHPAPEGYAALPAHPWQLDLLGSEPAAALADGRLLDLGPAPRHVVPTSSVRTVWDPATGMCLKFSLDVRITNCVRKNAWYELAGAVALTEHLTPVFADLAARVPGTRWLPEPGYRSAALGTRLLEGLGVIIRADPRTVVSPGVTPVLAGALAAGHLPPRAHEEPERWWAAYVARVAPPVLDAYFRHGVVLEPHLQNVLAGLDERGMPVEAVFRDLEGTKLLPGHPALAALPPGVAGPLTYDADRGWNRVVYCLVVNHLAEIAATLAAGSERALRRLWRLAAEVLEDHPGERMRELLTGPALPGKANLGVRWSRSADRAAGYVPVPNPLAAS
ncbi:siderophore synthetase component [Thermocatellispora tengchongensis]|uniref:Siderophore synthetase component n=1 Tax=Thermocatellispora tengchongensis TaxID=1073253 RepID=A0A840P8V4_9ACTN|nr:IucA/IucC family protein [Thermocatellispora tengchongensis]MBB5133870.1 siderophore synthetase component [Thermocatellispora tengchongensis]